MSTQAAERIKEIINEDGELTVTLVDANDKWIAQETYYDPKEAVSSIDQHEHEYQVFY